jgi:hypothetical protein
MYKTLIGARGLHQEGKFIPGGRPQCKEFYSVFEEMIRKILNDALYLLG